MKKLYVDDLRDVPEGWDCARNFHEAIVMLEKIEYDVVSLDHDIASFYGNKEMTGRDILNWLIDRKVNNGGHVPVTVLVHSVNPVGCATMEEDIARWWPAVNPATILYDPAQFLTSEKIIAAYLIEAAKESDSAVLDAALNDVKRARKMLTP